jgi:hypothetical protein
VLPHEANAHFEVNERQFAEALVESVPIQPAIVFALRVGFRLEELREPSRRCWRAAMPSFWAR